MDITEKDKERYVSAVYAEMKRRGFTSEDIPRVIAKTGFSFVMEHYPEEQLHYSVSDAVDEILLVASCK